MGNIRGVNDVTLQAAATGSGNGTAMDTGGLDSVAVQVVGTFSATVSFEGSVDGTNYETVQGYNLTTGAIGSSTTAEGIWLIPCAGLASVRAPVTWTSGTSVTVTAKGVEGGAVVTLPALQGSSVLGTVNAIPQGTTSNGLSKGKARDLADTVTAIKASAGTLYALWVENAQAAKAFIQVFDVATGGVTLATTNPDLECEVAANSFYAVPIPPQGIPFGTAISIASTTAEKGNTGSSAGVQVFWLYK